MSATSNKATGNISVAPLPLKKAMNFVKSLAFPNSNTDGSLRPGLSVALIGEPGIGKTAAIHALKDEMNYEGVEVLIGSQLSPEMIGGIPSVGETAVTNADGVVEHIPSTAYLNEPFQVRIREKKKVILLLDEYSNSGPNVQAAMLYIFNERRFPDGTEIPAETVILLATNSANSSVNPNPIAPPTQNRVAWLPVTQDKDGWVEGAIDNWGKPMLEHEPAIRKMVVKYMSDRDGALHEDDRDSRLDRFASGMDNNCRDAATYAWRSPRSWDNLIHALALAPHDDKDTFIDFAETAATAIIGFDGYNAFRGALSRYAESLNSDNSVAMMTIEEMFADPGKLSKGVKENDQNLASDVAERLADYIQDKIDGVPKSGASKKQKDTLGEDIAKACSFIYTLVDASSPLNNIAFRAPLHVTLTKMIDALGKRMDILGIDPAKPGLHVPHSALSDVYSKHLLNNLPLASMGLPADTNVNPQSVKEEKELKKKLEKVMWHPLSIPTTLMAQAYSSLHDVDNNKR